MRHDTGDHPAVKRILPSIYRSLENPAKKGFAHALFNNIGDLDIVSGGGIYLGTAQGYNVDLCRLDRVAARITTGLFYHEFGKPIPPHLHVKAYSVSGLNDVDADGKARFLDIFDKVTRNQPRTVGDGVFAYWNQQVEDREMVGAWVLAFYQAVAFLCFVTPRENAVH